MSPHAQTSFVNDLVIMAKAYEELPGVKAQLEDAQATIASRGQHIERLELRAHDYKLEIEALNARIHALEVDRDQAVTMFLEADERTQRALDFIKATFGNAGALIQALEPPRAEEPKGPFGTLEMQLSEHSPDQSQSGVSPPNPVDVAPSTGCESSKQEGGERAVDPTSGEHSNIATPMKQSSMSSASAAPEPVISGTPNPDSQSLVQGQSEVGEPVATSTEDPSVHSSAQNVDTALGTHTANAVSEGPYTNKLYFDHPYYVSLPGWLAGGGTEESYNWRPVNQMQG